MQSFKTFNSTGIAPNGMLYAGDINNLEALVAALADFTQTIQLSVLEVGDSTLQFSKFGSGIIALSAALQASGIVTGAGGLSSGTFTTSQIAAIATGKAPYGTIILNSSLNQYQWNAGTDSSRNWQPFAVGSGTATSLVNTLSAQPTASSVPSGTQFFATDQIAEYISTGSAWLRMGLPAGATTDWFSNVAVPTGWVAYNGGTLGGSTGIYAALYAALGNTTALPDTRGRVTVSQGTNTDVNTIGQNDGLSVGNRSVIHNSSNNLSGSTGNESVTHTHGPGSYYGSIDDPYLVDANPANAGGSGNLNAGFYTDDWNTITNPIVAIGGNSATESNGHTHAVTISGTVGPGGSRPTDSPGFIVAIKIAKL